MYSQNNEEAIILNYFDIKGFRYKNFLDIGAYNPFTFSNTRRLYEMGWKGVFVEPNKRHFEIFQREYGNDSDIDLLNVALHNHNGNVNMYMSDDAVSTTNTKHFEKWKEYVKDYKCETIECITPDKLLSMSNKSFDFCSIDTEGTNKIIFDLIPDKLWQEIKLLCIEHDNQIDYMKEKLKPFGFHVVDQNGENLILGK
jgi:FkbM family methyltransferase